MPFLRLRQSTQGEATTQAPCPHPHFRGCGNSSLNIREIMEVLLWWDLEICDAGESHHQGGAMSGCWGRLWDASLVAFHCETYREDTARSWELLDITGLPALPKVKKRHSTRVRCWCYKCSAWKKPQCAAEEHRKKLQPAGVYQERICMYSRIKG